MTPKEIFTKIAEIFSTGDVSEVDQLFHPDYLDHQRPQGWDSVGPDEFRQIVEMARKYLPNLSVNTANVVAEDDAVAGRMIWRSTGSSGEEKYRETVELIRLREGKAVEHWGAEVKANRG